MECMNLVGNTGLLLTSFVVFSGGNAYWADVEHGKRRLVEWAYHKSFFDFFSQKGVNSVRFYESGLKVVAGVEVSGTTCAPGWKPRVKPLMRK